MTTKVLIKNLGPDKIEVIIGEAQMNSNKIVNPNEEITEYVHIYQDLKIRELKD